MEGNGQGPTQRNIFESLQPQWVISTTRQKRYGHQRSQRLIYCYGGYIGGKSPPSIDLITRRGASILSSTCLPCGRGNETIDHIFYSCQTTTLLLRKSLEVIDDLLQSEVSFDLLFGRIQSIIRGWKTRGLQWCMLAISKIHITSLGMKFFLVTKQIKSNLR